MDSVILLSEHLHLAMKTLNQVYLCPVDRTGITLEDAMRISNAVRVAGRRIEEAAMVLREARIRGWGNVD